MLSFQFRFAWNFIQRHFLGVVIYSTTLGIHMDWSGKHSILYIIKFSICVLIKFSDIYVRLLFNHYVYSVFYVFRLFYLRKRKVRLPEVRLTFPAFLFIRASQQCAFSWNNMGVLIVIKVLVIVWILSSIVGVILFRRNSGWVHGLIYSKSLWWCIVRFLMMVLRAIHRANNFRSFLLLDVKEFLLPRYGGLIVSLKISFIYYVLFVRHLID
jgi:hypothetical protein